MKKLFSTILITLLLSVQVFGQYNFPIMNIEPATFAGYTWQDDMSQQPCGPSVDNLNCGAQKLVQLGGKVLRVNLGYAEPGPYFPLPPVEVGQNDYLRTVAQMPQYQQLFSNPSIDVYILTGYTLRGYYHVFDTEGLYDERQEWYKLAVYLGDTYPTKQFILSDWEGNNYLQTLESQVLDFQQFSAARVVGIMNAGKENVKSGLEFNRVSTPLVILADSALRPDYLLYSAWETTNLFINSTDSNAFQAKLQEDIDYILTLTGYDSQHFIIGEFGRAEGIDQQSAFNWFSAVNRALRNRAKYAIYWRVVGPTFGQHHGAFDIFGNITPNGTALSQLMTQPVGTVFNPKGKWKPIYVENDNPFPVFAEFHDYYNLFPVYRR